MQRLDKRLSEAGVASRRELKAILKAGRVQVNGEVVRSGERKVDETADEIRVDGVVVAAPRQVLWMLHKPAGYVTATEDPRERTVMELVPEPLRALDLKPVGRLDKDTEGLLLFTNDGKLLHDLISPRRHVWKRYYAEHEGRAGPEDQAAFAAGMPLGGGETVGGGDGRICAGQVDLTASAGGDNEIAAQKSIVSLLPGRQSFLRLFCLSPRFCGLPCRRFLFHFLSLDLRLLHRY